MVKDKENLAKDLDMLERLNKGWPGAYLSVERAHELFFQMLFD